MKLRHLALTTLLLTFAAGCGATTHQSSSAAKTTTSTQPPPLNVYANDGANHFVAATQNVPARIYVPNSDGTTLSVIDPATDKVINTINVGKNPQHVVPSWDLKTLYVTNDLSNSLTPIDPMTGNRAGPDIPVDDPYNMYFTPDGKSAIVVAEAQQDLDFRDPHTFALQDRLHVDCAGVDHVDFSADGKTAVATCEFSGKLAEIDLETHKLVKTVLLKAGAMPQDIKLSPDGSVYYVADMMSNGVWVVDAKTLDVVQTIPTGPEAHGLYPSRDDKDLYVSNRGGTADQGSISVIDFDTRKVVANWPLPAPATPDMGNVSADGKILWLSGRRSSAVYAIDTTDGHLIANIPVGAGPHGLCVWPQPGTYSLGHTGILR
jgi:YVTN family beta-propeller protein